MRQVFSLYVAFLWFVLPAGPVFAQQPAIVPAPTPTATDSLQQASPVTDTISPAVPSTGTPIRVGTSVLTPDGSAVMAPNPDTLRVNAAQETQIRKIVPRKATIRSLILPGLGQVYNRQYYKIPFIYGGFGVIGYLFLRYRRLSKEAEEGYRLLLYGRPNGTAENEKVSEVLIGSNIFRTSANAKSAYDLYRRYRDLNTILFAVVWAVNAIEANVAAHLKTFDLSDDISMRANPTLLPLPGSGFAPGVRVALTFK